MTPNFDPTRVDWNNPNVEYVMKHAMMTAKSRDDEIATLKKLCAQLQAKYYKILTSYNLLEDKKGTVPNAGKHK